MADDAASSSSSSSPPPSSPAQGTGSSSTPAPPAAGASSSSTPAPLAQQSCAACRYRRYGCKPECPFAAHFPSDEKEVFKNVRRLFRVRRVQDMMAAVEPGRLEHLIASVKWEAEAWAADPVRGALGVRRDLERQLRDAILELTVLQHRIRDARQQEPNPNPVPVVMPRAAAATTQQQLCEDHRSAALMEQGQGTATPDQYRAAARTQHQGTAMPNEFLDPWATQQQNPAAHIFLGLGPPAAHHREGHQVMTAAAAGVVFQNQNVMMQQTPTPNMQYNQAEQGSMTPPPAFVFHQQQQPSPAQPGIVFQQQQQQTSPGPSRTAPWYQQQHQTSPPPSP